MKLAQQAITLLQIKTGLQGRTLQKLKLLRHRHSRVATAQGMRSTQAQQCH